MTAKQEAERLATALHEQGWLDAAALLLKLAAENEILTAERESYASAMERMKVGT